MDTGAKMGSVGYPYFFLGFQFEITELDPSEFTDLMSNLKLFKRFTEQEAFAKPGENTVKNVQVMCGTPVPIREGEPMSVLEYKPIMLKEFVDAGCCVIPQADLKDTNNLKVYLNGAAAIAGEDYALDTINNRIIILWTSIALTDTFSYCINLKQEYLTYAH